jgi:hypothetical protein
MATDYFWIDDFYTLPSRVEYAGELQLDTS